MLYQTMGNKNRYQRQIILPEIGQSGQGEISKSSILCVGAGGLGCPALLYLTAAGVGRIGIMDFDKVDETNLQRQVLFTVDNIGGNKADKAKKRLHALNPEIEIETYPEELTDKNAEILFQNYDIIIDGTDNFASKYLINDAAVKVGKPFIYGSILGFDGQVSVFNYKGGPCYRCLFPETPKGHIPNCAEAGVIGAVAGIVGTAQAMEAIKVIVGNNNLEPLAGKLWTIDMHDMETRILNLPKNPDCQTCSKEKNKIILYYSSPVCSFIPELTPEQTRTQEAVLIIDVRENHEWAAGHIDGAKHIALSGLMNGNTPDLPTDSGIILYCQMGQRSMQAAQILKSQGYDNVSNMTGGYAAWLKSCA